MNLTTYTRASRVNHHLPKKKDDKTFTLQTDWLHLICKVVWSNKDNTTDVSGKKQFKADAQKGQKTH